MAINPISLAESLRPFRAAGLTCFLDMVFGPSEGSANADASPETDEAVANTPSGFPAAPTYSTVAGEEPAERCPAAPVGQTAFPRAYAEPNFQQSNAAVATGPSAGSGSVSEAGSRPVHISSATLSPQISEASPSSTITAASAQGPTAGAAPVSAPRPTASLPAPAAWPAAWRELYAALRPAPVLWSYAELGLDLSGQGSAERSAALKQIIGTLQLPRGTSVFWPQYLPGAADAQSFDVSNIAVSPLAFFASGLELLSPKTVILLGCSEELAEEFGFTNAAPYSQGIVRGRLYIHLPDMAQLIVDTQLVERACIFLRNALTAYPSLFRQK